MTDGAMTTDNGAERGKPSYYAILTAEVRYDPDLRPNAKLLYAEITALANKHGYCWMTNRSFAKLFSISPKTVSDLIGTLAKKGYITVEVLRDADTHRVLKRSIRVKHSGLGAFAADGNQKRGEGPPENGAENKTRENSIPHSPQRGRAVQGEKPKERGGKSQPKWCAERFEGFWSFYPRHEDRAGAVRAWDRLRADDALIAHMARALAAQKASESRRAGIGIPYACRWLRNRRWEDEVTLPPDTGAAQGGGQLLEREVLAEW